MRSQKELNIKWLQADIQLITNWMLERNLNRDLNNLNSYQSGDKSDTAMNFLVTTKLDVIKSGVIKEKT